MQPRRVRDTDIWPDNWKEWAVSLVMVGIVAVSIAAVIATGAFTALTIERTANVAVAGDASATIALHPYDGPNGDPGGGEPTYARIGPDGQLELNTAGDFDGTWGKGVNLNANTDIENVFTITNEGSREVAVRLQPHDDLESGENGEDANGEADAVLFYHTRDDGLSGTPETPLEEVRPRGSTYRYEDDEYSFTAEEVELDPGERITVSLRIDTSAASVAADGNVGDDLVDSLVVVADTSITDEPNTEVGDNDGPGPDGD